VASAGGVTTAAPAAAVATAPVVAPVATSTSTGDFAGGVSLRPHLEVPTAKAALPTSQLRTDISNIERQVTAARQTGDRSGAARLSQQAASLKSQLASVRSSAPSVIGKINVSPAQASRNTLGATRTVVRNVNSAGGSARGGVKTVVNTFNSAPGQARSAALSAVNTARQTNAAVVSTARGAARTATVSTLRTGEIDGAAVAARISQGLGRPALPEELDMSRVLQQLRTNPTPELTDRFQQLRKIIDAKLPKPTFHFDSRAVSADPLVLPEYLDSGSVQVAAGTGNIPPMAPAPPAPPAGGGNAGGGGGGAAGGGANGGGNTPPPNNSGGGRPGPLPSAVTATVGGLNQTIINKTEIKRVTNPTNNIITPVRKMTGEVSTGSLHPYQPTVNAADSWRRQQQAQSDMNDAIKRQLLDPLSKQIQAATGKKPDVSDAADNFARSSRGKGFHGPS
jgi:hypothetical protein